MVISITWGFCKAQIMPVKSSSAEISTSWQLINLWGIDIWVISSVKTLQTSYSQENRPVLSVPFVPWWWVYFRTDHNTLFCPHLPTPLTLPSDCEVHLMSLCNPRASSMNVHGRSPENTGSNDMKWWSFLNTNLAGKFLTYHASFRLLLFVKINDKTRASGCYNPQEIVRAAPPQADGPY